mmetsp:Transcript_106422/g.183498  ORF Transcript_106422/g.183498 Transcript_106422/m.183498 type:complete len:374 (-) Transcript_106422:294-1415(-)
MISLTAGATAAGSLGRADCAPPPLPCGPRSSSWACSSSRSRRASRKSLWVWVSFSASARACSFCWMSCSCRPSSSLPCATWAAWRPCSSSSRRSLCLATLPTLAFSRAWASLSSASNCSDRSPWVRSSLRAHSRAAAICPSPIVTKRSLTRSTSSAASRASSSSFCCRSCICWSRSRSFRRTSVTCLSASAALSFSRSSFSCSPSTSSKCSFRARAAASSCFPILAFSSINANTASLSSACSPAPASTAAWTSCALPSARPSLWAASRAASCSASRATTFCFSATRSRRSLSTSSAIAVLHSWRCSTISACSPLKRSFHFFAFSWYVHLRSVWIRSSRWAIASSCRVTECSPRSRFKSVVAASSWRSSRCSPE